MGAQRRAEARVRDVMGKAADAPPDKVSKASGSTNEDENLSAWDFVRVGLALTLIFAAVVMVVAGLGRITSDTIPVALFVFAMLLIVIWGGLTLVAVPTLLIQRVRRAWACRRSKRRASLPGIWDDWIDGPHQ